MTNEDPLENYPQVKPRFRFPLDQNLDGRLDDKRRTILAAAPLILFQSPLAGEKDPNWYYHDVESNKDLTIYGDVVKIVGKIKAPEHHIAIFCRVLQVEKNGDESPALGVSGPPGEKAPKKQVSTTKAATGGPGWGHHWYDGDPFESYKPEDDEPGGDGGKGENSTVVGENGCSGNSGGSIHIVCRKYAPDQVLDLYARGGNGGKGGAGGPGGEGGNGGPGDDASRGDPRKHYSTRGGDGGPGGKGGPGGQGGAGGDGGEIVFLAPEVLVDNKNLAETRQPFNSPGDISKAEPFFIRASVKRGDNGKRGDGGPGGRGGQPGPGGKGELQTIVPKQDTGSSSHFYGGGESQYTTVEWSEVYRSYYDKKIHEIDRTDGHRGKLLLPSPPGNCGEWGDPGDPGDPLTTTPKEGSLSFDLGITEDVLARTVHNLKESNNLYQTWDLLRHFTMLYQRARALYLTIGMPIPNPDDKVKEDIIVEIYQILDWISLYLEAMPVSDDANLGNLHKALSVNVKSLLHYYLEGADAFGHYNLSVPRGSFSYYYAQLNQAMPLLYRMETDYAQMVESSKQAEDFLAQVDKKGIDVSKHLDSLNNEITMTISELDQVADLISVMDSHVLGARQKFADKMRGFQDDLAGAVGLGWGDVLDALEMMAFVGSDPEHAIPMGRVQLAKLGLSAFNELYTDSGRKVKKEYVVTQAKVLSGDFSKLGEGFHTWMGEQTISMEDQGAARLYVKQSEFNRFFDDFLLRHSAQEAKEALNEYVDSVQERNVQIDAYNLLVARLLEDENQIKSLQAQQNLLAGKADLNIQRQKTQDYLISAYNSLRDRCIRLLYMTGRAYYFLSLNRLDLLGEQLNLGPADQINLHSIIMAKSRIIDADAEAIEQRVTPPSLKPPISPSIGGHGVRIAYVRNKNKDDEAPYNLVLKRPKLLDRLEEDHNVSITLTWDNLMSSGGKNPFSGEANVRLRRVRCWIYGLPTNDHVHRIRLVHGGDEEIIRPNGESIEFKHTPLQIQFEYNSSDPKQFEDISAINNGGAETPLLQENGSFIGQGIDLWDASHYAPVGPFTNWKIKIGPNLNDLPVSIKPKAIQKLVLEFFYYFDALKLER